MSLTLQTNADFAAKKERDDDQWLTEKDKTFNCHKFNYKTEQEWENKC